MVDILGLATALRAATTIIKFVFVFVFVFDKRSAVDKRIHKVGGEATGSTV